MRKWTIVIASLTMVCMFGDISSADLNDGLVAYYPFEGNTNDASGNDYHGIPFNGLTFSPGLKNQAALFDGVDDYIEVSIPLDGMGNWSICSLIHINNASTSQWQNIVSNKDEGFMVGFKVRDRTYRMYDNPEYLIQSENYAVEQGEDISVCYVKDLDILKIYKDGEVIAENNSGDLVDFTELKKIGVWDNVGTLNHKEPWNGLLDELRIYNRALSDCEVRELAGNPCNYPPISVAGDNLAIRPGDTVFLDGTDSYDDNTASDLLQYSWSFFSLPAGSTASLTGSNTATPSFCADVAGTYVLELIVTDEGGLSSTPDQVEISSDNLAPAAAAGDDQLVIIGTTAVLDGSGSTDPENDLLTYAWTITAAPTGSITVLSGASMVQSTLVPDLEGLYEITLEVSDFIGPGTPDTVTVTATTANNFAEIKILAASDIITALGIDQVTTKGNKTAMLNFLSQAVLAIQSGDLPKAIDKLEKSIVRTDGCVLRGSPDGNGSSRDWIIDCEAQTEVYNLLNEGLNALRH